MKEEERNEDLNPHSLEIEEKVRQMLDPSIPDPPKPIPIKVAKSSNKKEKIIVIKPTLIQDKKISENIAPSAPALQSPDPVAKVELPSVKPSKKVIIPIKDHDSEKTDPLLDSGPRSQLAREKVIKPIKKTNINSVEQPELAQVIPAVATQSNDTTASEAQTAPELSDAEPKPNQVKLDEIISEIDEPTKLPETSNEADQEIPIEDPAVINDASTDKAVAEIIASESDEILEIEDAVRDNDKPIAPTKKHRSNLFAALKLLAKKPAFRWIIGLLIVIGTISMILFPTSRYFALNTIGVRAASSLIILDESTGQPLKNVSVVIGGANGKSDSEGIVKLSRVKLGNTQLQITKFAFASKSENITVGWGSNPLGEHSLTPTGTQYTIITTDYLSGNTLAKVAASSGQADAQSDDKGIIKLTIEKPSETEFAIMLKLDGYKEEELKISPDNTTEQQVKLVPAKKHAYLSKRTGKYDLYSSYIDGKDERIVLSGSGNERDDLSLVAHPSDNLVAYVSTRPGQRNSDGFVLSNLIIVNLGDSETTNVASAEQIRVISWDGDNLVYMQIAAGTSADKADRYRLMSFNQKDGSSKELAKSNFFNDVIAVSNTLYYAPSSALQTEGTNLYRINSDGTKPETIYNKEVWNIIRTSYDQLALSVQQQWYELRTNENNPTKLNNAPANQNSRIYHDSPNGKNSLWIDNRDGKGTLIRYEKDTKTEKTIISRGGVNYPAYWLNDSVIVFRISSSQETADYAVSIDGGEPAKINDVSTTKGITSWLY